MPYFLVQLAYTDKAWAAMVRHPQNRLESVRPAVQGLGGNFVFKAMAFGEYDVVAIVDMPNNVSAAAFSMAVSAGGAVRTLKTTPLMTMEESVEAMKRAGQAPYKPPE
ncbi:MAG: GYD domain-containing protein [Candidatus Rokuibacteriota bacterium]